MVFDSVFCAFEWDCNAVLDGLLMVLNGMQLYGMFLVGGFNPSEKYEFVKWDDEVPN